MHPFGHNDAKFISGHARLLPSISQSPQNAPAMTNQRESHCHSAPPAVNVPL